MRLDGDDTRLCVVYFATYRITQCQSDEGSVQAGLVLGATGRLACAACHLCLVSVEGQFEVEIL